MCKASHHVPRDSAGRPGWSLSALRPATALLLGSQAAQSAVRAIADGLLAYGKE